MTYDDFTELRCWQECRTLVRWIWDISRKFPPEEKYDLTSNMNRAARSTTRNLAEGFGKYYYKENIRFSRICIASIFEVKDDLITARDCSYISHEEFEEGVRLVDSARQITRGYIRYLKTLKEKDA